MNQITILALAAFSLSLSDCRWFGVRGNGRVTTEERPVAAFNEIHADGNFDIEWRNGLPELSIKTDENLLPYIESTVTDNKLRLHIRERILPTHGAKVVVSSPTRSAAQLRGAIDMKVPQLSGGTFAIETRGASDVTLDGTVDLLVAEMTGASDLKAKSLQAKTAEISTTGAADAIVNVSEALRVTITGAGDVVYYGTPKTIEKHVTGAGSIRHKD
jgi:hypothetical protein